METRAQLINLLSLGTPALQLALSCWEAGDSPVLGRVLGSAALFGRLDQCPETWEAVAELQGAPRP